MLSVSNVSAKMATNYYEKDNYYARDMSNEDKWQGKLAEQLDLPKEKIEPEQFNNLINENPKLAGYDLTFSAPKSVSVAMVVNDDLKNDMLDAHNKAVERILNHIEKSEIETRITKAGVTENIKTGNMAVGKFNHYVSRNSDMQLHTHCVILNKTEYNEKIYAIDNKNLYKNHILYGQLYRNELAKNLQEKGYEVELTDSEKGFFELKGIEQETLEHFSTRRAEIMQQLKSMNANDAASAEKATLMTRSAKQHRDLGELQKSWRATLDDVGGVKIEKQAVPIKIDAEDKTDAFDRAVSRLAEKQYAFSERELERATLAEGCTCGMNRKDFNRKLSQSRLIRLGELKDAKGYYYTTTDNQLTEEQIKRNIELSNGKMYAISEQQTKNDLRQIASEKNFTLSQEQIVAVHHITTTTNQFIAVQGLAGTGKTYMLSAAREVWENNGYKVKGASFTGKAAEGLQTEAKIKSTTLHSMLNNLERQAGNAVSGEDYTQKVKWNFEGLKPSTKAEVWVIDEAGLTENNLMLHLQKAAIAKNAKVVLVGDYQQLAPVGVGNSYSNLVQTDKISTCYLSDIRRQKNEKLLQAVRESVKGNINKSMELVADSTVEIPSATKRFRAITKEYISLTPVERDSTIILAAKNTDRIKLNQSIRDNLVKLGELQEGQAIKIQTGKNPEVTRNFSTGDKIIFFQNDHKIGIMNGQQGKVLAINGDQVKVGTGGKEVLINSKEYNHFDHGYASTHYKAQGMTVDRAIINIDSSQKLLNNRNSYYVDISRARHKVSIYTDNKAKIGSQVGQWGKKITSNDFVTKNILSRPKFQLSKVAVPKITAHMLNTLPTPALNLLTKVVNAPINIANKVIDLAKKPADLIEKVMQESKNQPTQRRWMHM